MFKILTITPHYYSNFPFKSLSGNLFELNSSLIRSSSKIVSKNFIMFLLFLKFFNKKNQKNNKTTIKFKILMQPTRKNIFNFLRAPYKNKLARNQLYTPIFKCTVRFFIFSNQPISINNTQHAWYILNFFLKNFLFFESNITYLSKIRFNFCTTMSSYWNYNALFNYNEW